MTELPLTVERLRRLLVESGYPPHLLSLDGQRADETYVLEHHGKGWLVYFLERGRKREFSRHNSEDAACRDLLARVNG